MESYEIDSILNIILLLENLLGITTNVFIVAVISLEWVKHQHRHSSDIIVLVIAISRVFLLSVGLTYTVLLIIYPEPPLPSWLDSVFIFLCMCLSFSSFWFTALLYVYCCVTIANFHHPLFASLKVRIPRMMPQLILGCFAVSVISTLPRQWIYPEIIVKNSTDFFLCNISLEYCIFEIYSFPSVIYVACGYAPPFLIFSLSAALLIASLFRHMKRMQQSASGFSSPRLDAHYRAVKSVLAFFLVFALFCTASLCENMCFLFPVKSWFWLTPFLTGWYPFVHSAIMVHSYPKLSKASARILRQVVCWKKEFQLKSK